jgi:hypothetical protein
MSEPGRFRRFLDFTAIIISIVLGLVACTSESESGFDAA